MFEKRKKAIFEKAQEEGLIGPEEALRTAFLCQTFASPLLLTPLATIFVADQRVVIATGESAYTLRLSKWKSSKPLGLVSKHALGSTRAKKTALSLKIEDEQKLYAYLFQFGDMRKICELIVGDAADQR